MKDGEYFQDAISDWFCWRIFREIEFILIRGIFTLMIWANENDRPRVKKRCLAMFLIFQKLNLQNNKVLDCSRDLPGGFCVACVRIVY